MLIYMCNISVWQLLVVTVLIFQDKNSISNERAPPPELLASGGRCFVTGENCYLLCPLCPLEPPLCGLLPPLNLLEPRLFCADLRAADCAFAWLLLLPWLRFATMESPSLDSAYIMVGGQSVFSVFS